MLTIYMTILGGILGSFATMLIHRLHFDEKGIWFGRSACPHCHKNLGVLDLIPVFSWIFLRGKCRHCSQKISGFYPLTELLFAMTFFFVSQIFESIYILVPALIITFVALVCFVYDVRFMEVDDRVVYPFLVFWGIYIVIHYFFPDFFLETFLLAPVPDLLVGALLGWGFYAAQYYFSAGKWVGAGDMRLGFFMGIILGWKYLLLALFLAYILGSFFAIYLLLTKKAKKNKALPMGAFLMPSLLVFMLYGEIIWEFYWRILL
jgi:prepilin signal peptidase PulO-like enzyme (type II secretory pathway)